MEFICLLVYGNIWFLMFVLLGAKFNSVHPSDKDENGVAAFILSALWPLTLLPILLCFLLDYLGWNQK